jgi:calcium-dependent protein kinase
LVYFFRLSASTGLSLHSLHRDLKYENVLFVNDSPQAEIKLIDFGLSRRFGNKELTDTVGTTCVQSCLVVSGCMAGTSPTHVFLHFVRRYTMAPEVIKGKYTKQAELWSIGVISYMLMSSQMPFYGRKRSHIIKKIVNGYVPMLWCPQCSAGSCRSEQYLTCGFLGQYRICVL